MLPKQIKPGMRVRLACGDLGVVVGTVIKVGESRSHCLTDYDDYLQCHTWRKRALNLPFDIQAVYESPGTGNPEDLGPMIWERHHPKRT